MNSDERLIRHVEINHLSYFLLHLRTGPFFEIGYYSATKGVEHITEELSYVHHSSEVLNVLDQKRLPLTFSLITTCAEVQATGDIFTDKDKYYCIKIYDYRRTSTDGEKVVTKWMVVRWIMEEDIPCHLDLYPNHPPILKDDPCMGDDRSVFSSYVMNRSWFQRRKCLQSRHVTRRHEMVQDIPKPNDDLSILKQASEDRKTVLSRLASSRRAFFGQKNCLDNSSQLAITRDFIRDFPVNVETPSLPADDIEWPTEFSMEPYVDLELFIQPPNRSSSKLHLSVSMRLPDQRYFARFCAEDPPLSGISTSVGVPTPTEYTTNLGGRTCRVEDFLRQYTELVTDRGRYPAQIVLTYAGQQPRVYKEYPYFFGNQNGDFLLYNATKPLSSSSVDDSSGPLSVG